MLLNQLYTLYIIYYMLLYMLMVNDSIDYLRLAPHAMASRSRSPVPRSKTPLAPLEASAAELRRMLTVIEDEVLPKTQKGVREGNKVFGAAVLRAWGGSRRGAWRFRV